MFDSIHLRRVWCAYVQQFVGNSSINKFPNVTNHLCLSSSQPKEQTKKRLKESSGCGSKCAFH